MAHSYSYLVIMFGVLVVGQLHQFKGDWILHPVTACVRRLWVTVLSVMLLLLHSAYWDPFSLDELVATVVNREYFQGKGVDNIWV